jgi:hypothetical protein
MRSEAAGTPALATSVTYAQIVSPHGNRATKAAAGLEKLSVHVNDVSRSCSLVQVVNVLGAKEEFTTTLSEPGFKPRERGVRRVRLCLDEVTAAHVVELMHLDGIASECLRGGELHGIEARPDTGPILVSERAEAALG